jgi:hypothetical protein
VAPAAVHIPQVQASLRKDFSVAAQNCWVKKGGAFTGELRWAEKGLACWWIRLLETPLEVGVPLHPHSQSSSIVR